MANTFPSNGSFISFNFWSPAYSIEKKIKKVTKKLEVPSLKTPTVNIGDRQKGRLKASSVVDSEPEAQQILAAIKEAFYLNCSGTINPYGDGKTAPRISKIISEIDSPLSLVKKHFFDVSFEFNQEMI